LPTHTQTRQLNKGRLKLAARESVNETGQKSKSNDRLRIMHKNEAFLLVKCMTICVEWVADHFGLT